MAVDDAMGPELFNFSIDLATDSNIGRAVLALYSLPYVWGQRNTSLAGAPPGFNGT
jgi:hypothetical protein